MSDTTDAAFDAGTNKIAAVQQAAVADEMARTADSNALLAKIVDRLEDHNAQNMVVIKKEMVKIVTDALGEAPSRYIDVGKIPLLCKSIFEIRLQMRLIMWIMGVTGAAIIMALVGKVFKIS